MGGTLVSIIRVGLTETKGYGDGYDAIFKKDKPADKPAAEQPAAGKPAPSADQPAAKKG